jgi:hypothetical protein
LRVNPVTIAPIEIPLDLSWIAPDGQVSPVVESPNVTVEPKELARVDGKALRCARTGDGIVRAQVGERSASARFKCLMAYALVQGRQPPLRVLLGSPPQPSNIFAILSGGAIASQVAIALTSDSPDVLAIDGDRLLPKKLGRATITATAPGPLENSWTFEVADLLGHWPVDKGFTPLSLELSPGNYEVVLACAASRRATVNWTHAPQCNYAGNEITHRVRCRLDVKSRVIVVPPPFEEAPDILELFKVPP